MTNPEHPLIAAELTDEIRLRAANIAHEMRKHKMDAMLISSNANIYYTSGRFFRGYAYITAAGEIHYFLMRPVIFSGDNVIPVRKPEQILSEMERMAIPVPQSLGLELDTLTYSEAMRLEKAFPEIGILNASPVLSACRQVKTPFEIAKMKADGVHQAEAYRRIPHIYKEDMTDLEFQIELERVLRLEGCLGCSRVSGALMEINLGSVINGDNADVPTPYDFAMGGAGVDPSLPVGADGKTMMQGTSVMVDMNGNFNGYQTDMTRVWTIGDVSDLAVKAHECSRSILRSLEKMARPGVEVCSLHEEAMRIVAAEGLEDYFMGHSQKAGFIGHGVGIELNEKPAITARCREELRENMTLAIEPKFVIPHVGAVGVENTYIVTPAGLENITIFPEELQEL